MHSNRIVDARENEVRLCIIFDPILQLNEVSLETLFHEYSFVYGMLWWCITNSETFILCVNFTVY